VFALTAAAHRPARRSPARRPPDRAKHRGLHLHGPARHFSAAAVRVGQASAAKIRAQRPMRRHRDIRRRGLYDGRQYRAARFPPPHRAHVHARRSHHSHRHHPARRRRAFQLFDGIQTVATGALRAQATPVRHALPLTAYWIIGLPLGAWLCFRRHWEPSALGRPKPRANPDRNRPALRLASHRPQSTRNLLRKTVIWSIARPAPFSESILCVPPRLRLAFARLHQLSLSSHTGVIAGCGKSSRFSLFDGKRVLMQPRRWLSRSAFLLILLATAGSLARVRANAR